MDGNIGSAGLSGSELAQTLPSSTAIPREPYIASQHIGAVSSDLQKADMPSETRQGKPIKGLVQEVAFANAIADFLNQKVAFRYDERIDQIVVTVTRGNTEEVIRQIPSEEMIDLIAKFRKEFRGLIFNRTG